jgi:long-chain acyl-CoA synthetase
MYSFSRSLRRAALVNPNGIANRFEGRETTWLHTLDRVRSIASVLASASVSADVRVGMLGANSDVYYQCLFAVPWAGGIAIPINMRLALPEIVYCLDDAGVEVLLVDDDFVHLVPEILHSSSAIKQVICIGEATPPAGAISLVQRLPSCLPLEDQGRGGNDVVALYYTGGTTGKAKGVILTHEAFLVNVLQWSFSVEVSRRDVFLIVAPIFHLVGGLNAVASAVLAAGLCIVLKFDAAGLV